MIPEHSAVRASRELAFFLDDDFVVKIPVHEVSPHSVPVLDFLLTFRAIARAVSVLHTDRVGYFFRIVFFDCYCFYFAFFAAVDLGILVVSS